MSLAAFPVGSRVRVLPCPEWADPEAVALVGVVVDRRIVRLVDAKSGRVSRDWRRGAAACEATYGLKVEEVS